MGRRFTVTTPVRWADVDLAGAVYFPQFFRFFNIAEEEFYRSLGRTVVEIEEALEIRLPRVDAHCRFLQPAHFGDLLSVALEIGRIGAKTIKYEFDVQRGADAIAEGHIVIASVNMTDFKAIPLPDDLRTMLEPYAPAPGRADPDEVSAEAFHGR